jgi:hypothetical protein
MTLFVDGLPARITRADFKRYHLQHFPGFIDGSLDDIVDDAIEAVYTMFTGVQRIWDWHPPQVWYDKTVLCFRLLTAWYIADMYPMLLSGIPAMGGIPLKAKKIGGVHIMFPDAQRTAKGVEDMLASLKSNPFGVKAAFMLKACGKKLLIWNWDRRTTV